ncbi:MAG: hypothetical protein HND50_07765 [Calditrichaeota bacterium]|nr:hypothetical protein [Calditrichota bacterium]
MKQGNEAIHAYFESFKHQQQQLLNECKIILIGDGSAGKTSLVKCLMEDKFNPNEPQTHGIRIRDWKINNISVHFWDFGGQDIMHASHTFFLSKRSLYLLVLDGRKDEKTEYWLKHIQTFGGNAPVIIVLNKADENPAFDLERKSLKRKYPNIEDFVRFSCSTGEGKRNLELLLKKCLPQLELVNTPFAQSWFNIKNKLRDMKDDFISYDDYLKLCHDEGIKSEEARKTLITFLDNLGIIVHYPEMGLEDTHVLNPRWLTNAVYKIINSKKVSQKAGVLDLNDLSEILKPQKDEENPYHYPKNKHDYIINIMKKFEICFPLDVRTVLIPDLLCKDEPDFTFDKDENLQFIFQYDFLPKSVFPRFMVQMQNDIESNLYWRSGVVLMDSDLGTRAVIRCDDTEKQIYISVIGEQKRDYFAYLRKAFRIINDSFEIPIVDELIPLPDNPDFTVSYEELIGLERMRETHIAIGKLEQRYSISKLLDGIEKPDERKMIINEILKAKEINMPIDNRSQVEIKDSFIQKQSSRQSQKVSQKNKNVITINEIQGLFKNIKEDLIDEADISLADEKDKHRLTKELEHIEKAFEDASDAVDKEQSIKPESKNRIETFVKSLENTESRIGKVYGLLEKGKEYGQKFYELYNKIAPVVGLASLTL